MITIVYATKNILERRPNLVLNSFKSIQRLEGDYEVLVSDYGSNDGIKETCEEFGFRLIHTEPDPGVDFCIAKCYNHGIQEAKGDIIWPMATDMIISQDSISLIEDAFKVTKEEIIGLTQVFHWKHDEMDLFPMRSEWRWMPTYKKKNALFVGGYDERFKVWGHEDIDFIARMNEKLKIQQIFIESVLCLHQWHGKEHQDSIELQEGGNPNAVFFDDNRENNSKNMVNSYW